MRSKDYWKKRSEVVAGKQFKKVDNYILSTHLEYMEALSSIQKDIEVFYSRFSQNNEISLQEARRLLNSNELHEFKIDLKEFTRKAKDNKNLQWERELNNVSYKVRVTRLQALQTQMRNQIENLYTKQQNDTTNILSGIYEDTYYRNIFEVHKGLGIGINFAKLDTNTINKVITEPWHGDNYSSRIWNNKEKLIIELQTNLTQSFIRGDSIDKTSKRIAERMSVAKNRARTLVNTESANIISKSTFNSYIGSGVVKEYEILATLDLHTSKICRSLDGKIFKISEKEIGVNAPPFHPNCRTTIIPYFSDAIDEERIARDSEGEIYYVDGNMNYGQWYKENVNDNSGKKCHDIKSENNLQNTIKNVSKQLNINEFTNEMNQYYKNGNEKVLMVHENQMNKLRYSEGNASYHLFGGISLERPNKMINRRNKLGNGYIGTLFHETGHGEDFKFFKDSVGNIDKYMKNSLPMSSSYYYMKDATKKDKRMLAKLINNEECNDLKKYIRQNGKMNESLSDICVGITNGKLTGSGGHTAKYFKDKGKVQAETFANLTTIYTKGDKETIALLEKYFPNTNKEYFNLVEDMIKENYDNLLKKLTVTK
ncbi:phage minor capsid protein [Clostridium botulinum H04402 065]|uniref:minor capsid protein n=1 Tax=Clostridium botulinum TaxID=1491 RepID=UPI0001F84A46|nr:minor capsid protein [Clostridium botulinum]CBZ04418.1 phage minor capsid protein [Clostridium botulinum H04402 065]